MPNQTEHYEKTAGMLTGTCADLASDSRRRVIRLGEIIGFSLFLLLGSVAVLNPMFMVSCLAAVLAIGLCWLLVVQLRRWRLELWQTLALIGLSGHMLLNYGFENLAIHVGGFPIIVSYGLMFASLALAVYGRRRWLVSALKEPVLLCAFALLVLTVFHLIVDIPQFGLMAARDASMCVDALFLLLGMAWATKTNGPAFLAKWLTLIFALNLMYSATLPWGEKIWSWSPQSGVFLKVPLLGSYNGTGDLLLAGALFCICVGPYVVRRPRWLMPVLALAQVLGLAITQVRRMYVGAVVVLIILVLAGESKKFAKVFILLPAAAALVVLATSVGGVDIPGRVGSINADFFKEHFRSITNSEGTPGSSVESRFTMADEAIQHFQAHPVFGTGFGLALLTEMDTNNVEGNNAVTRTPHNSSLTYLARLGAIGFMFWIGFHFCLIRTFLRGLRLRRFSDPQISSMLLWLFLYYVLFVITSLVEAPFEFPSGAIPFYFLMGFALGLLRWHMSAGTAASRT